MFFFKSDIQSLHIQAARTDLDTLLSSIVILDHQNLLLLTITNGVLGELLPNEHNYQHLNQIRIDGLDPI